VQKIKKARRIAILREKATNGLENRAKKALYNARGRAKQINSRVSESFQGTLLARKIINTVDLMLNEA